MSVRQRRPHKIDPVNPLFLMAAKQAIDQENVDKIALIVLIAFDAAKRGEANNALVNTVTEHLATAQALWAGTGNRPMYDRAITAWKQWCKACCRDPEQPLRLSTQEYTSTRIALGYYLRALPKVELGRLVAAKQQADSYLKIVHGKDML